MSKVSSLILLLLAGHLFGESLIVHVDTECRLSVDGKDRGSLKPGKKAQLKLVAGVHHIEATPASGGSKWLQAVTVTSSQGPQTLNILVHQSQGYWIDPASNLMWTAGDNGSGLSWSQARRYCTELTQNGFKDWTLPGIEQLQGLFTTDSESGGFHIKGSIKLSGWQWSSSPGQQPGEGWAFDFGDGGRASVAAGDSGLNRALCVRPAN